MPNKPDPVSLLDEPEILAEPVAPEAAIKFWQERAKLTWDQAKELADGAKARAFYVTGLYQQDLVQLVSDGIEEALKNGETLADFKKRIANAIQKQGWQGYRVENIFRTNMQSAYAAGRYRKMQAVKKSRPYWQYLAIMDKRTRPNHAALHGKIYPADHEFWNTNYPPNGFRCRCGVATLSQRQVDAQGLTVETEMPKATFWTDPETQKKLYVQFPGADKGFANNPYRDWAKNGGIDDLPGLKDFTPVKKAAVTQKSLQADIQALDEQIKAAKNEAAKAALEAQKAEKQALLDKKAALAKKNKLKAQTAKLETQLQNIPIKTYSGIWQSDVTTADWSAKAHSILAKKEYFTSKLTSGGLTNEEKAKFEGFLKDLDEFSEQGQAWYNLQQAIQKNRQELEALKTGKKQKAAADNPADPEAYTKQRKDAALWARTTKEADDHVRPKCGEVWKGSSELEKDAIYDYTAGSGKFNRPLSGYQKPYAAAGSGWEEKYFKGVGNVWLDYEDAGDEIRRMTEMISRSTFDFDMKLQRGSGFEAIESHLGIKRGALSKMSSEDLQQYAGKWFNNPAFTSSAVNEGAGFSSQPVIWYIYAPRGTQMMYAEPFSHYGAGGKRSWDGEKRQTEFGSEAEMIIQRGATFRITRIEKKGGKIYMEVEVHPERGYKQPQQDPDEWKGSKDKFK